MLFGSSSFCFVHVSPVPWCRCNFLRIFFLFLLLLLLPVSNLIVVVLLLSTFFFRLILFLFHSYVFEYVYFSAFVLLSIPPRSVGRVDSVSVTIFGDDCLCCLCVLHIIFIAFCLNFRFSFVFCMGWYDTNDFFLSSVS